MRTEDSDPFQVTPPRREPWNMPKSVGSNLIIY